MNTRKNRYNKIYKPLLPKNIFTMLDIGCGKMIHTRYFNFSKCTAIDIEQKYKQQNIKFIKLNAFKYFSIFNIIIYYFVAY